ncbi:PREDICTED: mucin-17 [Papilio polytes]|uniref:mucin-17 n=1 Tax=Papilio polytes TaxID=76194 RepID=UPI00067685B3|nr:PREDICTED: mucin-17 [Papilio polytes]XP_013146192.1 PREDICTED: mucin-17 [Papilio polytes]
MEARRAAALLALAACVACSQAAPTASNQTALDLYEGAPEGCYYNFQHYGEGDRIMTNEPCLNCTCHNRMLMCYLRVCPFTKPIGQDCTVEKRADQCCPIVTCPDVPVDLLTSTSTSSPAEYGATGVGHQDKYGCSINGRYFSEGSKVPSTPNKPCEHCYCIRNMTTCVMQECTLHVDGCVPIYHKDVCCPVRYSCDHPEDDIKLLDDMTTTVRPTPGFLLTTTTLSPVTQVSQDCVHDDQIFADGALIKTEKACEHCYCMKGDIVCVVQECGTPMENEGKNCTSLPPRQGQCCPDTYICEGDELPTEQTLEPTTEEILRSTSITPPRKGVEGSGYRNEPDEPYTDLPIFDTVEVEGSGEDQSTQSIDQSESVTPEKPTPDFADEMLLTTAKQFESKPTSATEIDIDTMVTKSDTSNDETTPSHDTEDDLVTESTKLDDQEESKTVSQNEVTETTHIESHETEVTVKPLLTTLSDFISSTFGEGLIPVEDKSDKTTESSFRKEDDTSAVPEITTQKSYDALITESEYYEQKETKEDVIPTTAASLVPGEVDDKKEQSLVTTTEIVMTADTDKDTTEKVDSYSSSTTIRIETTSLNPTENEVDEEIMPIVSPGRIPGEGDCLLNGITYQNTTEVPSTNKCHTGCRCVSSIIKCDPIICSAPPEYANMNNCKPIYDSAESCCPTYICDHTKEDTLPESHSQMSGTESPKPTKNDECIGDKCLTDEDKHTLSPIPSEPCTTENCDLPEKQPVLPECGKDGCIDTVPVVPESPAKCDKETGCQVTAVTPCEGDNCKDFITPEPDTHILSPDNQADAIEKECNNDSCRRKEHPQDAIIFPSSCVGPQCETNAQTDFITSDITSEIPIVSEEVTKISHVPITISAESQTTRTEEKFTTLVEESTSKYDSTSSKIDVEKQELTTESVQFIDEVSSTGITREPETITTEHPKVEEIPDNSFNGELHGTTIAETDKEHLTTSHDFEAPQPTISDEKTELQQTVQDLGKDFTTLPQTSRVEETQGITKSEEDRRTTMSQETAGPSDKSETTADQDKATGIEVHYETTPVYIGDSATVETYTTESVVNKEKIDKQDTEKLSTAQDSDYITEISKVSKDEDVTTPESVREYSTSSPQSQSIEEKTTETSIETETEKVTTNLLDESPNIIAKDESTTSVSDISVVTTGQQSVTERAEEAEKDEQPTEQSIENTKEDESTQVYNKTPADQYDISSVTPDSDKYKKDQPKSPEIVYTTENPILDVKETIKEESSTDQPVTDNVVIDEITHPSGQDQMESLNGMATEGPDVHEQDSLQTMAQDADLHTTVPAEAAVTSSDEKHLETVTTEKSFEQEIKTETPKQYETETIKVVTESVTAEPERGDGISEDEKLDDDKEQMFTTNVVSEFTTVRVDTPEQTVQEDVEDHKEGITNEVTPTLDHISSTETIKDTTEVNTESNSVTLAETHNAQSDSTDTLSFVTEESTPERQVELTTTSLYPSEKETTEDAEGSGDITKQQDDLDEQQTSKPTKIPEDVLTEKQDVPLSITTALPDISDNILHTTLLEEHIATQSPSSQVTENIEQDSLPTRRVADHNTEVTVSIGEESTTKSSLLTETITDKSVLTTKANEIPEIEEEKVTIPTHTTDFYKESQTTKIDLISEEDFKEKTTMLPEAVTSDQHITNAVTQKDPEITIMEETKPTETPEKLTSKAIVTELEAVTEKLSTSDLIKSTEEPEKTTSEQDYTEPIIENVTTVEDKYESTVTPDAELPSKLETENPELTQTVQDISRTTAVPDLQVTESHIDLEKTTIKTIETNIDLDENTVNIEDLYITKVTESPAKVTETYDVQKQTLSPETFATTQQEPLLHETTVPEIQYEEKTTESAEKIGYPEQIPTESSEYPSKPSDISTVEDGGILSDKTQEEVTLPEVITESVIITTESPKIEENVRDTETTDEKTTEQPLVHIDDAEKEIDLATDKPLMQDHVSEKLPESNAFEEKATEEPLMEEHVTEKLPESNVFEEKATDKPLMQDHVTEKLPESNVFEEKTTEKPSVNADDLEKDVDFVTDTPMILEHVTEKETGSHIFNEKIPEEPIKIEEAEKELDYTTDLPMILEHATQSLPESHVLGDSGKTPPAEQAVTEIPEFVTGSTKESDEVGDIQEYLTTEKPEKSTLASATVISEHKDTTTTVSSEVFIPIETSSYLPDKGIETEEGTTVSDEKSPGTESKPVESTILTELPELLTTSKSDEDLGKVDLTEATESSISEVDSKTSGTTPIVDSVPTYILQETDIEKPTTDEPLLISTTSNENEKLEGTTQKIIHEKVTEIIEPSTVEESQETTSERELDTVKINANGEDKTIAYIPEQYTEMPEQIFTEVHKSPSESSESDITVTEISQGVTHSPDKYTTNIEEEQTFTHEKHEHFTTIAESLITQEVETGTVLPTTLSSEKTTQEIEISEAQSGSTIAPELHKYTTGSNDNATPTLIEQTVSKETVQTEPVTVMTPRDEYTQDHEVISDTKETKPDYYTTEKIEISTQGDIEASTSVATESSLLESKPTSESSPQPQHTEETSEQIVEHSESTPYFVELEEHTHKGIEETTPEVYHEDTASTTLPEILYPGKLHDEITTVKQEAEEATEITTEGHNVDESLKITTEKQEIDESTIKEAVETATSGSSHPTHDDKITTLSPLPTEIETDVSKLSTVSYDKDASTFIPVVTTTTYEEAETPKQEEPASVIEKEKESAPVKPTDAIPSLQETTAPEEEFIPAVTQGTTSKTTEDITTLSPTHSHKFTQPEEKPIESLPSTSPPELQKPGFNEMLPTDEIPPTDEDSHFPPTGSSGYGQEPDYGEEDQAFGPGTCRYGGKVYVSAQQIPRDDPCDFCFCFRSDIICLQQSCPPPIHGCHEEPIQGFCCPRYECPVSMATTLNITTTTTTTTTTLPPHFLPHAYKGAAQRRGCQIKGHTYKVGEVVRASSGPCLHCTCGGDGQMKCDPKACTPEPMLRQMIAAAVSAKRRR